MRKETATKVANLLSAVAVTLKKGRPRMRPGNGWRPEAVNVYGTACRPSHHKARQYSLLGAIAADAKALGYNWRVQQAAQFAILDAESDKYNGGDRFQLELLDGSVYDTRAIIRRVQKAQHKLERELATA